MSVITLIRFKRIMQNTISEQKLMLPLVSCHNFGRTPFGKLDNEYVSPVFWNGVDVAYIANAIGEYHG